MKRKFNIGDVLSVTTGRLVSMRGMGGIYDVLNFMNGDNLMTHALPRARDEMLPVILDQHPQLADVDMTDFSSKNWLSWLGAQIALFGDEIELEASPREHLQLDPLDEPSIRGKQVLVLTVKRQRDT